MRWVFEYLSTNTGPSWPPLRYFSHWNPLPTKESPLIYFTDPTTLFFLYQWGRATLHVLVVMYGFRLSSLFICVLHQLFCVMAPKKELKKKKTHEFRYSRKIQIIKKTLYNKTAVCISQSWNNYFLNTWSSDNCFHSYEWSTFDLLFSFKEYEDLAYQ